MYGSVVSEMVPINREEYDSLFQSASGQENTQKIITHVGNHFAIDVMVDGYLVTRGVFIHNEKPIYYKFTCKRSIMEDYSKLTDDDFDRILSEILSECTCHQLLAVPGLYDVVSEHFHNEILSRWEVEQENQDN